MRFRRKSTVSPGLTTLGSGIEAGLLIASPEAYTNEYPVVQVQVPMFLICQIFAKDCSGLKAELSETLRLLTNSARLTQAGVGRTDSLAEACVFGFGLGNGASVGSGVGSGRFGVGEAAKTGKSRLRIRTTIGVGAPWGKEALAL
jgi:hypothetical protein